MNHDLFVESARRNGY